MLRQSKDKGKAIPFQALTGPEGSRKLRLPGFLRESAHEGGKDVSPTHQPPLLPDSQEIFPVLIMSMKNSNEVTIGDRSRDVEAK
jgi:hypothetical protein